MTVPAKRKLLMIEWKDHCSHGDDWRMPKTYRNRGCDNVSVGWVIAEDKNAVTISSTFADADDPDEVACGAMTILKKAITGRRVLK